MVSPSPSSAPACVKPRRGCRVFRRERFRALFPDFLLADPLAREVGRRGLAGQRAEASDTAVFAVPERPQLLFRSKFVLDVLRCNSAAPDVRKPAPSVGAGRSGVVRSDALRDLPGHRAFRASNASGQCVHGSRVGPGSLLDRRPHRNSRRKVPSGQHRAIAHIITDAPLLIPMSSAAGATVRGPTPRICHADVDAEIAAGVPITTAGACAVECSVVVYPV